MWGEARADQAQARFHKCSHLHAFRGVKIDATFRAGPFMFFIKPNVKLEHLLTPHCKVWTKYYYVLEGALYLYYEISRRRFSVLMYSYTIANFFRFQYPEWRDLNVIYVQQTQNVHWSIMFLICCFVCRTCRGHLLLFIVGGISMAVGNFELRIPYLKSMKESLQKLVHFN